jgi:hypothetical protein
VAQPLLTIEVETAVDLIAAFDRVGPSCERFIQPRALARANAIRAGQQARVARRTGATAEGLVVEADYTNLGYIVRTDDVRSQSERASLLQQRAMFGSSRRGASVEKGVAHVGKYLEYGTVHESARPFFWEEALVNEGAWERDVAEAVQEGIDVLGLGDSGSIAIESAS